MKFISKHLKKRFHKKDILIIWAAVAAIFLPFEADLAFSETDLESVMAIDESAENANQGKSTSGTPSENQFEFSLGAGLIISPRPYVGSRARVFPIPALELQYKRWFIQGIRGGYSFIESDKLTANLFAQMRFRGLEPENSPYLEGMDPRKKSMDSGIEFIYSGRPVGFRATALTDTLGRSKGQEISLMGTSGIPMGDRGIILFGIGPRWLSHSRVDYYYGIRENEATPTRLFYVGPSTWNLDINVTGIVNLNSKWRFLAILNREGFGSGIKDSPIVEKTSAYAFITSLSYKF